MYRLIWILFCITLIAACQKTSSRLANLPQDKFIQAYFNHRQSNDDTYIDPYRQIEHSGDNLEAVTINEIEKAKNNIDLAVQELNLPLVAQALAQSYRSGVKIRVILDNNYSRPLSSLSTQQIKQLKQRDRQKYNQFFQLVDLNQDGRLSSQEIAQRDALAILKQAGIPVIDDAADGSKGSGLMHHKFMVVDGEDVVTGSANLTTSGVHGDIDNLNTRGNVNHLLTINNKQVASLFTEEFNYMWGDNNQGGLNSKFGLNKPWRSPVSIQAENTQITIQFSPTPSSKNWHDSTNGLIAKTVNEANKSIDLALFVFSDQELANTLQSKQHQGLSLRGVFDSGFAFRYYSEVLDMRGITLSNDSLKRRNSLCQAETGNNPWQKPLQTMGIANISAGDKLHHKFALIDDRIVISGSQNWSEAANSNNDEAVIVIDNPTVAQHFKQEFENLYQAAFFELPPKIETKLQQQQSCQRTLP